MAGFAVEADLSSRTEQDPDNGISLRLGVKRLQVRDVRHAPPRPTP